MSAPFDFWDGTYPGTGGNCGDPIIGGKICQIVLEFRPAVAGNWSDQFVLEYDDGTTTRTITKDVLGGAI